MPHINPQPKPLFPLITPYIRQLPNRHHIIKPVIVLIARLKQRAKLQVTIRLRRPRSLEEDVRAVVGLEVVPCVCAEDAGLWVCDAPVGAYVEDFTCVRATISMCFWSYSGHARAMYRIVWVQ